MSNDKVGATFHNGDYSANKPVDDYDGEPKPFVFADGKLHHHHFAEWAGPNDPGPCSAEGECDLGLKLPAWVQTYEDRQLWDESRRTVLARSGTQLAELQPLPPKKPILPGQREEELVVEFGELPPATRQFRIGFDRHNWWVGYYHGVARHYVCILPTLVISWNRKGRRG